MSVWWTYGAAPKALWNTANIAVGSIPLPKTQLTEQEWKDALALQATGKELVDDPVTHKPIGQDPATPSIGDQRAGMIVERLYFHDACRATSYGGGTVWSALQTRLAALSATEQARYADISTFHRLRGEAAFYFQDASGVDLDDTELDTLFTDAMTLQAAA